MKRRKLKMLAVGDYVGVDKDDPIRFYNLPFIGRIYRERVERCLSELSCGAKVLEIGFGSGVAFLNLSEMYDEVYGIDLTADIRSVAATFNAFGVKPFLKNGNILDIPYPDNYFDTVLLVSILEHLKPNDLRPAFSEIRRVLKNGGQVVYGIPVERPLMVFFFKLLGYDIRKLHFSTEEDCFAAAHEFFSQIKLIKMRSLFFGCLYQVAHFVKQP